MSTVYFSKTSSQQLESYVCLSGLKPKFHTIRWSWALLRPFKILLVLVFFLIWFWIKWVFHRLDSHIRVYNWVIYYPEYFRNYLQVPCHCFQKLNLLLHMAFITICKLHINRMRMDFEEKFFILATATEVLSLIF